MQNVITQASTERPLILTVPGLNNSGPGHWQTLWEVSRRDCERVDLGMWDRPHRNTWVNKLNLAIHRAGRPVVLVAHSLGCLAVAWWARYEKPKPGGPVLGALLVAPPDVDDVKPHHPIACFAPMPEMPLPFPSILAASRDDPYMTIDRARVLARSWGSQFADAGHAGHINADSGIGEWSFGQFLLGRLISRVTGHALPAVNPGFHRPDVSRAPSLLNPLG